jgi:glycosyltransferase involved in cell wall biosynthesis
MTRLSCRRARRVICVSQATADETVRLLGLPRTHIDIVPHGVQHARFYPLPAVQVERFRDTKGLPQRFILFLGTLEPRKNLTTLIDAFHQSKLSRQGIKLVIAGGKGWYYQQIFRRVEVLNLTNDVIFTGFVPDEELPLWYNAATLFVYPSIYEGFGMPLLEAMACGTPVIASNVSCMPEVVGQSGVLVPPHALSALAEHMAHFLNKDDLRAEYRQRGQARAGTFTWEIAAQKTVDSYRRALAT